MGANNVGLIYGTTITDGTPAAEPYVLLAFAALAVVGMVVLGRDGWVSGTVGDKLVALTPEGVMATFLCSAVVVWFGTQLALPISITQCLLGGMLGAAFTKHIRLINRKIVLETTVSWILVPSAAFVISFALTALG
jgi:phosphate/sulfate permease